MAWSLGIILSLGSACSAGGEFLPRPELAEDEVVFILSLGPDRAWLVQGPIDPSSMEERLRRLEFPAESEVFFARVSVERLRGLSPVFDETRRSELGVEVGPELCATGRREGGWRKYPLEVVLPTVLRAEDEWVEQETPAGLVLRVPIDPESCWARPSPDLRPFGDDLLMMRPGVVVDGVPIRAEDEHAFLGEAYALGPDHVITASFFGLKVFERGRAWSDDPRHLLSLDALPPAPDQDRYLFRGLVVGPSSGSGEHVLRVAYIRAGVPATAVGGGFISATWTASAGFGQTRNLFEAPDIAPFEMRPDGDGGWISVGNSGVILTGELDEVAVTRHQIQGAGDLRRALNTGDPEEPQVIVDATQNLYFGDPSTGLWRAELSSSVFGGVNGATARATPAGTEVYLAPFSGGVTRRTPDGRRIPLEFELPPEAAACAAPSGTCGLQVLSGLPVDLDFTPDETLLITMEACGMLIELDVQRACSRALPIPFESSADAAQTRLRFARFDEGRLFVTGREGLVAEAEWR